MKQTACRKVCHSARVPISSASQSGNTLCVCLIFGGTENQERENVIICAHQVAKLEIIFNNNALMCRACQYSCRLIGRVPEITRQFDSISAIVSRGSEL